MSATKTTLEHLPTMIRRHEFCAEFGVPLQTAASWASRGTGPRVTKIGRACYYKRADLELWLESLDSAASAEEVAA